jgi:ketosteroid isomerase-like protein
MPANEPTELAELYCRAFNARDLDAIVALYEANAVLTRPGREFRGLDDIREAVVSTLATTTIVSLALVGASDHRSGDTCLSISRWSVERRRKDGSVVVNEATTLEVSRRQDDGAWKIIIDDPIVLNSA